MLDRRAFLQTGLALSPLLADHPFAWTFPQALAEDLNRDNPFLRGNFAPVREESTLADLKVIGTLPDDLDGMYVRNGPNPQFPPKGRYHWFDGDGMLHGVRLHQGKASYRNRYIRTPGFEEERRAGKALYGGLNDPPDLAKALGGKNPNKHVANTALVWHHRHLLALWEGGEPYHIGVPELNTIGPYTFGGKLRHAFTAHPKIDATTGEMFCFGYRPIRPYVQYSIIDAKGELVATQPIDIPRPVMMHDFGITQKYAIFLDLPVVFDLGRLLRGEPLLQFEPKFGARIGILPRRGGQVRWFEIAPCYVFHLLNAWEEEQRVIVLGARYAQFPEEVSGRVQREAKPTPALLHRWQIDLTSGRVQETTLDDTPIEFPRIADHLTGRPVRFGYTGESGGEFFAGFRKFDLQTGKTERHSFGRGRFGGEGVFVPRANAQAEDDGYLLTYVHDANTNRGELLIVNAADMRAEPIARVLLPVRVPYGFHGIWIPGAMLG